MPSRGERALHVFTARMAVDEYEALRSYAFFAGQSVNEVVVSAIREYLRSHATDEQLDALVARTRTQLSRTLDRLEGTEARSADRK